MRVNIPPQRRIIIHLSNVRRLLGSNVIATMRILSMFGKILILSDRRTLINTSQILSNISLTLRTVSRPRMVIRVLNKDRITSRRLIRPKTRPISTSITLRRTG